jgi:peptidoglycan/LPS O-acetylase OafA/YrhL
MVLTEKYRNDTRAFYTARLWRLYPLYAAVVIFMVFWFIHTKTPTAFTARLPVHPGNQILLALLNVVIVGQDLFELAAYNHASHFFDPNYMLVGQAWSLSSELFFYALAPFVVRFIGRTTLLLAAALVLRFILLGALKLPWSWGYFFFPGSICMFLMGSLAYHLHRRIKIRNEMTVAQLIAGIWIAYLVYSVARYGIMLGAGDDAAIDGPSFWLAYVAFALSVPIIFSWSKSNRIDRAIGDLSYPLYLVHGVVQGVLYFKFGLPQGKIAYALIAVSASIIVAAMALFVIDRPAERWRHSKSEIRDVVQLGTTT